MYHLFSWQALKSHIIVEIICTRKYWVRFRIVSKNFQQYSINLIKCQIFNDEIFLILLQIVLTLIKWLEIKQQENKRFWKSKTSLRGHLIEPASHFHMFINWQGSLHYLQFLLNLSICQTTCNFTERFLFEKEIGSLVLI